MFFFLLLAQFEVKVLVSIAVIEEHLVWGSNTAVVLLVGLLVHHENSSKYLFRLKVLLLVFIPPCIVMSFISAEHGGCRGHVGTEAWVGDCPPAVRLRVGWSSLSSARSFVSTHTFFPVDCRPNPPQIYSLYPNSGTTLVGLALIWEHNKIQPTS